MNVRRMPSAPPKSPASNTTLSRGDAWLDSDASAVVQSSRANTNAAKSTSCESSTSRSSVDRPGLKVVIQGSTSATSSSPRVIAWSSLACLPDDPRKMRGFVMCCSPWETWRTGYAPRSWAYGAARWASFALPGRPLKPGPGDVVCRQEGLDGQLAGGYVERRAKGCDGAVEPHPGPVDIELEGQGEGRSV